MKLNFHKNHNLLFGVVLGGFIALSLIIAVGPAFWVQNNNKPLQNSKPLTALQKKGLSIYIGEGCEYCHTQQVRPLAEDKVFGRPSTPGDYAYLRSIGIWRETPNVLGTERTGPDLSNVGNRQPSDIWNYIHLYNPRAVVKESVMPAFPWLFKVVSDPKPGEIVVPVPVPYAPKSGKVVPTDRARALVAYVLSLKQIPLGSIRQKPQPQAKSTESEDRVDGKQIYLTTCAACHQANGKGISGAFPPLAGDPVVNNKDATQHILTVLGGLHGKTIDGMSYSTTMPSFGQAMSNEEVAAVINYERTHFGNKGTTITAEEVEKIRKTLKKGNKE